MEANNGHVSMKSSGNRVVDEMVQWAAKEAKMKEMFGGDIVNKKHFAREKYDHYARTYNKFKNTKDPDERAYLNVMAGEMKEIKKIALPNKYVRFAHDVMEFTSSAVDYLYDGLKAFYNASKQVGKSVTEYQERRKEQRKESLLQDKGRQETKKRYDEAVRARFDKVKEKAVGPDPRRNNIETDRGGDEQKIRYSFDNDAPLLSKKTDKAQTVTDTDESLMQKNREGTGKGVKI